MKTQLDGATASLNKAAKGLKDNTIKLTVTTTKYSDMLQWAAPLAGPANSRGLLHLPPQLQAREGVKARQVLIDFRQEQGPAPFRGEAAASVKARLDKALKECEEGPCEHKVRAATRLWNGGILMELDSNEAITWFSYEDKMIPGKAAPSSIH